MSSGELGGATERDCQKGGKSGETERVGKGVAGSRKWRLAPERKLPTGLRASNLCRWRAREEIRTAVWQAEPLLQRAILDTGMK